MHRRSRDLDSVESTRILALSISLVIAQDRAESRSWRRQWRVQKITFHRIVKRISRPLLGSNGRRSKSLRPNPKNARTHSKKQIRQIGKSISEFGFLNPVVVDDANMILAGHGRFEAARLEGLTHVPIVRFGHLTEAQKRAYAIADNRIAEQAGWDRQRLSIELGELIDLLPTRGPRHLGDRVRDP